MWRSIKSIKKHSSQKSDSEHFRRLIIQSMIRRYTDYVKSNDELRVSAIKMILEKLDIPVSELEDRMSREVKNLTLQVVH